MRSLRIVPFALALGFSAATCTNQSQLSTPALDEELAQAFCAHEFSCCSPAEIAELAAGRYLSQTDCLPYAKLAASSELALLEHELAIGHISVDDDAAQSCFASYAGSACNTALMPTTAILPYPDAASVLAGCPGLLVGQLPEGAVCTLIEECAPGTRCTAGSSVFSTTGAGGATFNTGFAGSFGTTGAATGAPGVCVAVQKLGEPCNQNSDCDPEANLSCSTLDFTCVGPAGPGASCGFNASGQTVLCDPAQGLHCDGATLNCRRDPIAGETCNFSLPTGCDPDPTLALSCVSFTNLCTAPGGPGDACGGSALAPCRWDLGCVPTQADGIGTCQPAPAVGEACNGPCQSPAVCDGAVCRPIGTLPAGAPCNQSSDCATLTCEPVAGQTGLFCVSLGRPVRCAGSSVTPGFFGGFMTGFGGAGGVGGSVGTAGSGAGGKAGVSGAGGLSGGAGGRPPIDGGGGITGGGAGGPPPPLDGATSVTTDGASSPPLPTDGG